VITDLIAPYFLRSQGQTKEEWWHSLELPIGKAFIGFVIILCLTNAYNTSNTLSYQSLNTQERQMLAWIAAETKPTDNFLVISEETNPLHSSLLEWFPALTRRHNITTVQGSEWLSGKQQYHTQVEKYPEVQKCLYAKTDCLFSFENDHDEYINYIVLARENGLFAIDATELCNSLSNSPKFKLVYTLGDNMVFKRLP
jgi:hypothetical protein